MNSLHPRGETGSLLQLGGWEQAARWFAAQEEEKLHRGTREACGLNAAVTPAGIRSTYVHLFLSIRKNSPYYANKYLQKSLKGEKSAVSLSALI